jgi:hypothetical protein
MHRISEENEEDGKLEEWKIGKLENWKIGIMENWNNNIVESNTLCALRSAPCLLPNALYPLLLTFATFKAAIPSKNPFLNDTPYGSGLASFILCPLPTAHCLLPTALTSHLSPLISHLSSLISMPSALCALQPNHSDC